MHAVESHTGRLLQAVRGVLPPSVEVSVDAVAESFADLRLNGRRVRARWAGEGGLRQAREVLSQHPERFDVVVARRMSPGARALLTEAGKGWIDETGAAEIAIGALIVSRSGRPQPRAVRSPHWTPAVLGVAEAILTGTKPTAAASVRATGLSMGSCIQALRVLTQLELLKADALRGRNSARRVVDPESLLEAYSAAAVGLPKGIELRAGIVWRDPLAGVEAAGKRWDEVGLAWALTGAAAAAVLAPHLSEVSIVEVFLDARSPIALEAAATQIGARPIEGGRLLLRTFPSPATRSLTTVVEGVRVVPWPRAYADLRVSGVRGEEAAEQLREMSRGR